MNKTNEFKLIDGCYNPDEATQVLLNLIKHKIDFHTSKLFSDRERGIENNESETRIEELRTAREKIKNIINVCHEGGHTITIKADLKVQVDENETIEISM